MAQQAAAANKDRLVLPGRSLKRTLSPFEIVLLVGLGIATIFAGSRVYSSLTHLDAAPPALPAYIPAFQTTLITTVTASGTAAAAQQASLDFASSGRVEQVMVQLGESVAAGQELARLESNDLELELESARLSLASAQANLDALLAEPSSGDLASAQQTLASAQEGLVNAEAALADLLARPTAPELAAAEQSLLAAEEALSTAEQALISARANLSDPANLEAVGSGALDRAIRSAELGLVLAQDNYDTVLAGSGASDIQAAELRLIMAGSSLVAAQAQFASLTGEPEAEALLPLQAAVSQAENALISAEADLAAATIRALFDGVVSDLAIGPGDEVKESAVAIVLLDPTQLEVNSNIDQSDIADLQVGQQVLVTLGALPGLSYGAEIAGIRLSPAVTQGVVTFEVFMTLDLAGVGPELPLPAPGMTAALVITTEAVPNALVVPSRALSGAAGQQTVTVLTEAGDEVRSVVTGETNGTLTQVLSGLEAGEEVLVTLPTSGGTSTQQTSQPQIPGDFIASGRGGGLTP